MAITVQHGSPKDYAALGQMAGRAEGARLERQAGLSLEMQRRQLDAASASQIREQSFRQLERAEDRQFDRDRMQFDKWLSLENYKRQRAFEIEKLEMVQRHDLEMNEMARQVQWEQSLQKTLQKQAEQEMKLKQLEKAKSRLTEEEYERAYTGLMLDLNPSEIFGPVKSENIQRLEDQFKYYMDIVGSSHYGVGDKGWFGGDIISIEPKPQGTEGAGYWTIDPDTEKWRPLTEPEITQLNYAKRRIKEMEPFMKGMYDQPSMPTESPMVAPSIETVPPATAIDTSSLKEVREMIYNAIPLIEDIDQRKQISMAFMENTPESTYDIIELLKSGEVKLTPAKVSIPLTEGGSYAGDVRRDFYVGAEKMVKQTRGK